MTKNLFKKCNWTWAARRDGVGEGCSERNKTYHKVFKEIFFLKKKKKSNIAQLLLNAALAHL